MFKYIIQQLFIIFQVFCPFLMYRQIIKKTKFKTEFSGMVELMQKHLKNKKKKKMCYYGKIIQP